MPEEIEKLPPQNIEAEQSFLGCLMLDKDAIVKVADSIKPDDFYRGVHKTIYQAMLDLYGRQEPIDLLSLSNRLEEKEQLEEIGGRSYLTSLVNTVPTAAHVSHYANIVQRKATLRRLIDASDQISNLAYQEVEEIDKVLDQAEQKIFGVSQKYLKQDFLHLKPVLGEAFSRLDQLHKGDRALRGLATGFYELDEQLAGLQKSDLIILASRPSLGKCVTADTEIVDPLTGLIHTIKDFIENKKKNILTLGENLKIKKVRISKFINDGKKPVYEVETVLGKKIKTTLTHPFLTINGWKSLKELKEGARIAVPRELPIFGGLKIKDHKVKTLAYFIADGGLTRKSPCFTNSDKKIVEDFKKSVTAFPYIRVKRINYDDRTPSYRVSGIKQDLGTEIKKVCSKVKRTWRKNKISEQELAKKVGMCYQSLSAFFNGHYLPLPNNLKKILKALNKSEEYFIAEGFDSLRNKNAVTEWLQSLNLMGKSALKKSIPLSVFQLNKRQMALFLNRLFTCDGSIYQTKKNYHISYSSSSKKLIKQVQHLLLRFRIISKIRLKRIKYKGIRFSYELEIHNKENMLNFIQEIGIYGKEKYLAQVKKKLLSQELGWTQDTLPIEVWDKIMEAKGEKSWYSLYPLLDLPQNHNIHAFRRNPRRETVAKLAQVLHAKELNDLSHSDIYWDRITSIKYKGKKQVYDLVVPQTHNFIANDFFIHNTTLALDFARNVAVREKVPVGIFSLEMSKQQLADRILAAEAEVDLWKLRTGKLNDQGEDNDFFRLNQAIDALSQAPIYIDDAASSNIMQMRTMARRLQAEHNLGLIIVDYLQLMTGLGRTESRVQEITEISRSLKALARELDVPVLALSQLSRAVEARSPQIPRLSDLRESGSLEQDSDVVLFIYREDREKPNSERKNIADIMIAKHRNGPIGQCSLFFNEDYVSFKNLEKYRGQK